MRYLLLSIFIIVGVASCRHVNVYEKQVSLPNHHWKKSQNAVLLFNIPDSGRQQLYLVVRHTEQFPFNKLLVRLLIQDSTRKTAASMVVKAPLTDSVGNWSGSAMGDVYYHRIKVNPTVMLAAGNYRFVLQQAMKEPVLPHILNVGIALNQ